MQNEERVKKRAFVFYFELAIATLLAINKKRLVAYKGSG